MGRGAPLHGQAALAPRTLPDGVDPCVKSRVCYAGGRIKQRGPRDAVVARLGQLVLQGCPSL